MLLKKIFKIAGVLVFCKLFNYFYYKSFADYIGRFVGEGFSYYVMPIILIAVVGMLVGLFIFAQRNESASAGRSIFVFKIGGLFALCGLITAACWLLFLVYAVH